MLHIVEVKVTDITAATHLVGEVQPGYMGLRRLRTYKTIIKKIPSVILIRAKISEQSVAS